MFSYAVISRKSLVVILGGVLIVIGVLSVVSPGEGKAVVTVSRFGSKVRLLPESAGLSLIPLARRMEFDRRAGAVAFDIPVTMPAEDAMTLEGRLNLSFDGEGPLPVDAAVVRARGWAAAWAEWAIPKLELNEEDEKAIIHASAQWRKIFPGTPVEGELDVKERLERWFEGVDLTSATLSLANDQEMVRATAGGELDRRVRPAGRLIVLGLDGLDWRLVDELTNKGVMPNIKRIIDRGLQAEVVVRPPLLSPLIWTSIATGVYPEVHGVLDFVERDPQSGQPRPVGSGSRRVPALWEIAAAAGRTTAVIGWWATFPAVAPPGATVYSDRLTEQIFGFEGVTEGSADPPEAAETAARLKMGRAELTPEILAPILAVRKEELAATSKGGAAWDDPIGGIQKLMAATLTVERLTDYEVGRNTEVVLVYLEGTDTVGHLFAPHRPPPLSIVRPEDARRFGSVVDRYYAHVDRWIGRIVAQLSERDTVAIVSDHGFRWFEDRPLVAAGAHTATAEQWHRREAVFIAAGPTIRRDGRRHRMKLLDVSASLFALAGLPPGEGMPGVVPGWLFEVRRRFTAPVNYNELISLEGLEEASRLATVAPEVTEEQLAKLRALGYIGDGPDGTGAESESGHDRFEARRLHNLALRLTDAGDLEGAEKDYRRAIEADPTYVPTHYAFAYLLRIIGRYDEADRQLWQAVDLDTGDVAPAVVRVAQHYRNLGQDARAEAVLTEGRRRFPESATIWLHLGALLGERGNLEGSRLCLERAVELDPRDPLAYRNLAALQVMVGDIDGAKRSLGAALALEPGNQEVRRQLQSLGGLTGP